MNKEVIDTFEQTNNNEYNKVELKYDLFNLEFLFPKKDIKGIKIDNLRISTNTLHKELQDSHHTIIEDNIFNQRKVIIDTYRKRIEEKRSMLQEIIFSFSLESLINNYHIVKLIDSVPFYINLNLFSLAKIIIQLAINLVCENKISIWTNEGKIKFYMSLFLTLATIYDKLVLNMSKNLKYFESLSILFNQCQFILLSKLNAINIKDLMLFITYFKYVFFQTDKKSYYHPNIEKEDNFLFTNTVNIIILSIIGNRGFSNIIKLQILRGLLFDNNLDPVKYYFENYNTEYFLYEHLHNILYFYEVEIYSTRLTRDYIKEVNNTGGTSNILNVFEAINSYLKFDLAKEYEEDTSIDISVLIWRMIYKLFYKIIECSISNYTEIFLHLKQVEMEQDTDMTELNKQRDYLKELQNYNEELNKYSTKIHEDITKTIDKHKKQDMLTNVDIGYSIEDIENLSKDLKLLCPSTNPYLNKLKINRGYDFLSFKRMIQSLFNYNVDESIYQEITIDEILFTKIGALVNDDTYKMLSDKDKYYAHCLIKDKYINSIPFLELDIKLEVSDKKINFEDVNINSCFCTFKDELSRYLVCVTEITFDGYYVPQIYQLEELGGKVLIQSFVESNTETHLYYYKDVLDLNNIKDYFIICKFTSSCHILLLNKETKLFEFTKCIDNENIMTMIIPDHSLKHNFIIIHNPKIDCNSVFYNLETNNVNSVKELNTPQHTLYHPYYYYDRLSNLEYIYIIECSINKIRLIKYNQDVEVYREYKTISNSNEDQVITYAYVYEIHKDKYLYCSSINSNIFIFNFENQTLLKEIKNIGMYMARLSISKILYYHYDFENKLYELKILDVNTNKIIKKLKLKHNYVVSEINPKIAFLDNNYLTLSSNKNNLSLLEIV